MLAEIKKCVDSHDIKGLRYIFVDSLDVDPTFEKYSEDFSYCKTLSGFFEDHQELTGLVSDSSRWDMEYWNQLKMDLMKNFSEKRFEHMLCVAKVVYADKITLLLEERKKREEGSIEKTAGQASKDNSEAAPSSADDIEQQRKAKVMKEAEIQEQRLEEKRKALEAENKRIEEMQKKQRARIEAAKKASAQKKKVNTGSQTSKKVLGIVLAIIVILAVALAITLL